VNGDSIKNKIGESGVESYRVTLASIIGLARRDALFLYAIFVISFFLFCYLSYLLFSSDFFHLRTVSYFEKARLALQGSPPRLENIGFVYPPLPVFFAILVPVPWMAQGFVAALVYGILLYFSFKFYRSDLPLFAAFPLFLPFLYLALLRFDILVLFFLVSASTLLLLKYWEEEFSLYLFTAGILFGLAFFIDFSVVYLTVFYAFVLLLKRGRPFKQRLGVALVFSSPVLFFLLFTLFINFVFKDDPFYFVKKYYQFFVKDPELIYGKADLYGTIALLIDYLKRSFLLNLPYFVGFFLVKKWKEYYASPLFLVYASPLLFSFFQIRLGLFTFSLSNSLIFLFFVALFLNRIRFRAPVYAALAVSLVASPFLFLNSRDLNEVNFVKAAFGMEYERNLSFYKEVAYHLNSLEGKILLDDRSLYPAVLFVSDVKKLILPYQYEFQVVLAHPCGRTDYAVAVAGTEDALYRNYPQIESFQLDGCKFYGRVGNAFIFSCSPPCR